MLKRSHRARRNPRKETYVSIYYTAQMLPQHSIHTPIPSHRPSMKWIEKDKKIQSATNFLFFFEIRIVLHLWKWLTCGRRRHPPTRGIKRFTRWSSYYYHFIIYYANYERTVFKNETKGITGVILYGSKALQTCRVYFFGKINLGSRINQVVGWPPGRRRRLILICRSLIKIFFF